MLGEVAPTDPRESVLHVHVSAPPRGDISTALLALLLAGWPPAGAPHHFLVDKQDGTVQSKYDLSEKLGAGAFGIVYRAKPKSGADMRVCKTVSKSIRSLKYY